MACPHPASAQSVTRWWFTPTVVPESQSQPVLLEAAISPPPASVVFNYNNVDRPMFDDGTNGDQAAADGVWTVRFTPGEILGKNTAARVFRPFIGFCRPAGGASFNIVAEVWTSAIGLREVRPIGADGQETDYIANYVVPTALLLDLDARVWTQRFYATHGDKYDFLNLVHIAGLRGNRTHASVKNQVQGIGRPIHHNSAQYGSAGRLSGINNFPVSSFFDSGDGGFEHETGHQWINFCNGTAFASGIPHWPKGSVAANVMGFSIGGAGGQGGQFPFTFTPNGSGGYLVSAGPAINQTTFNTMELYLMGMVAPAEVSTYFVLNNQNQNVSAGQTLAASEITHVTVNDVIASLGPRVPDHTQSQRTFRCATIVLSEQPLDPYAMSLYDFFARRCEARQPLSFASGLATGTCNPWYLATGERSFMYSKVTDDVPVATISRLPGDSVQITFAGKPGIKYQPQSSDDLRAWTDEGPPLAAPVVVPPADGQVSVILSRAPGTARKYFRVDVIY
jgi:hypothetical protein